MAETLQENHLLHRGEKREADDVDEQHRTVPGVRQAVALHQRAHQVPANALIRPESELDGLRRDAQLVGHALQFVRGQVLGAGDQAAYVFFRTRLALDRPGARNILREEIVRQRKKQRALAPRGPGEENILAKIPEVLQALVDDADIAPHLLERQVGGRRVIRKHIEPGRHFVRSRLHATRLAGK